VSRAEIQWLELLRELLADLGPVGDAILGKVSPFWVRRRIPGFFPYTVATTNRLVQLPFIISGFMRRTAIPAK
jgi:hypothetical protein